jgi:hypothetical protein
MTEYLEGLPRSLKGLMSEHHLCIDCGFNTAPGFITRAEMEVAFHRGDGDEGKGVEQSITEDSEVYIVRNHVWAAAGMEPYGGCLCIGCLEKRLGRRLKPNDFQRDHAFNDHRLPCTPRLRDRRGRQ